MKDLGLFTLPCRLGDSKPFDTLTDLGSYVNIIMLYLFKKLKIRLLEESENDLGLANGTKSYPVGMVRNVEVHVGKLKLLEDFYVVDMEKYPTCPLLVRRGFLATANALIDCKKSKIAVGEGITRSIFRVKENDLEDVELESNLPLQEVIILDPDDQPMWESAKTVAPTPNSAIIQLDVDNNFVINSTHLNMIQENKFNGLMRADLHDHIREFLAICNMFRYGETQSEAVKLLIFPFSLCDKAKTWFNELNEESITSWEQMRKAFINIFFSPSLFSRLLLEIRNFSQLGLDETQSRNLDVTATEGIFLYKKDVEPKQIILDPDDQPIWESARIVAPTPNYAIVQIDVDDTFVINSTYLKLICENKFDGYLRADQHDHIREFLAICNMFRYGKTQSEAIKLMIFPLSLSDEAKTWFNELNKESITSWDQMRKALINKFFPPSLFNRLLLEIKNFSQNVCENLTDAWLRLKNMLRKCDGHGLTKGAIIQIFYHGLDEPTQGILDVTTGGIFLYKSLNQAFQFLEDKVLFKLDWSIKSKTKHHLKSVSFADGSDSNTDNS
ncbi:reverse transcriptase domain-containing protein [Tanacetum coccineum]